MSDVRRRLRAGNLIEQLLAGGTGLAISSGGVDLTYAELREEVSSLAGGLALLGLQPGDRVAICAGNSLHWVTAYLAAQWRGCVVVLVNPAYKRDETAHIHADADPRMVLIDAEHRALVESLGRPCLDIADLRAAAPVPIHERAPEDPALIIYTSGTTGRPKGAVLDSGNLLAQARGAVAAWEWSASDRLVLTLPLFHLHGLGMGLHGALLAGSSVRLTPFDVVVVTAALSEDGGTMFFGVPTMYQRLCDHLGAHPTDLRHVRLFVSGSAPLPPALFARCESLLGQEPVERYGTTESGVVVSNPYDGPRLPGRVGYPLAGVEVRLGAADEVQVKGGQVFSGYWRQPAATRAAFADGSWFRTGDVGEIDQNGSLAIRGRLKEVIISGGFNVYPREVELVLESHPSVGEAAVVGVPSDQWGEMVVAFVVLSGDAGEGQLVTYVRERLATFKCPQSIRFVPELPRNAMGKVVRAQLRDGLFAQRNSVPVHGPRF